MSPADRHSPTSHQAAMGNPFPPHMHQLVGGILWTSRLPDNFVGALLARFRVTYKEGRSLSLDLCSGWGLYAYLGILAAGVDSAPGMDSLSLIVVDQYGEVNVLHYFFSVPVRSLR